MESGSCQENEGGHCVQKAEAARQPLVDFIRTTRMSRPETEVIQLLGSLDVETLSRRQKPTRAFQMLLTELKTSFVPQSVVQQ
jgi:hypothetical protein